MAKILILSTVNYIEDPRIFYKIIHSLKKDYNDIEYMVKSEKKDIFVKNSIKIIPLPIVNSLIKRVLFLQWIILLKIIKRDYDVIQFNNPELIFLGFVLKVIFKKKIVFDVHENFAESFKDKYWLPKIFRKILPRIYPRVERILIKKFDAIIIAEESYKKIYGEKAVTILNYPLLNKNNISPRGFNENINFVYVGGIMEIRCIFQLLQTFYFLTKALKNIHLFLVGSFSPINLEQKVKEYLTRNNIFDKVTIFGRKPLPEVYKILEKSHFGFSLMQPIGNYVGSLSTKIFDYMVHGIPFVVSDFGIYEKYVVAANTGLMVDQNNPEKIAESIVNLFENRSKLIQMSKNGREAVLNKWNWRSQEEKLLKLYKNILNGKK